MFITCTHILDNMYVYIIGYIIFNRLCGYTSYFKPVTYKICYTVLNITTPTTYYHLLHIVRYFIVYVWKKKCKGILRAQLNTL